ncbi:MAG: cupin domain-containing protein [Patiriisocius sp.]|uniref:cupin domain-containing protein n=1 Tax=Patiriisocius sp. TaxID=2822396 RepID=UPI003EFAEA9E
MIKHLTKKLHKNLNTLTIAFAIFSMAVSFIACDEKNTLKDPLQAGWNNQSVCEVVEENDKVRVLQCTFAPGVGHERHYHAAHFGYTVKGSKFRIKDTTGTREVNVPTGYKFYNEGIDWHEVLNIGDSTAVFLIMEPKT